MQQTVARRLVEKLCGGDFGGAIGGLDGAIGAKNGLDNAVGAKFRRIADIGSGSGAVWNAIHWQCELFAAVDFAPAMCAIHPKDARIFVRQADFNNAEELLKLRDFAPLDLIISSSSLQWANDLRQTLGALKTVAAHSANCRVAFAMFTSGTFAALRQFLGADGLLADDFLLDHAAAGAMISEFFDTAQSVERSSVAFGSRRELFEYIRLSGIGGGRRTLGFTQAKNALAAYPRLELEFETLYAVSRF